MSRKDGLLYGATVLALAALFAPILLAAGSLPGNFGDVYAYHYPLRHLAASTLQEGRLPYWNPYIFGGTPLLANPQSALFYPGSLLHYFFPLNEALTFDALWHLGWACLGAALLSRLWGAGPLGSWTLSIAYGLSPFVVGRIAQGIPTHLASLAWAPWIWLFAWSGSRLLLAAAFAGQILSGHPQFALLNAGALGLALALRRRQALKDFFIAGACGALLAALQILPTWHFLKESVRAVWDPSFSLGYSLRPSYLLTLLWPDFFGNPLAATASVLPSEYFEMLRLNFGLAPLGLAALGLSAAAWPLAVCAAGLFFALGQWNPLYTFLQGALGLHFLRVPARFSLWILLGLWTASGAGWLALGRRRAAWKPWLALAAAVELLIWAAVWIYPHRAADYVGANREVAGVLREGGFRIATSPDIPSANKTMLYRIPNATGYEAFYLASAAYYTARSERKAAADGSRTYITRWTTPEMSRWGVRFYLSQGPAAGAKEYRRFGETYIYENKSALPLDRGAKSSERPSPEHWIVGGAKDPAVVAEAYEPGWRAYSNGRRLRTIAEDGFFLSAPNPGPGAVVHFIYRPPFFLLGAAVSLMTAFGLLLRSGLSRSGLP